MAATVSSLPQMAVVGSGLSSDEAKRRLSEYGPNDPAPSEKRFAMAKLLLLFFNPLGIALLIAAVLAAFLGQGIDSAIIIVVLTLGNTINFWQTYRSEGAIQRLREVVMSTASVLRDGD